MISSQRIPPMAVLYIFIGIIQQLRHSGIGNWDGVDKEINMN